VQRKRIGDLLVEAGLLSDERLQEALQEQKELQMKLGDVLLTRGYISEQQLIEVLEFQLGIPHVQLFRQKLDPKLISLIPKQTAEQHTVIPIRIEGNRLIVAMADPLDYFAIDELRMITGLRIVPTIASKDELNRVIKRYYGLQESIDQISENLALSETEEHILKPDLEEQSPVVKTVNQIISQAVELGASDIHIDPQDDGLRIRYRIDGMVRTERTMPIHMQSVIVARIKIMANLNVSERRVPQDGRIEMEINYRKIDIRLSTLPTIYGEKIVMRILDMGSALTEIDRLGMSKRNMDAFKTGITRPFGVVLITGPTGSGKTTTLYSALSRLNQEEVNIITIEDPVEYQLLGINQVQVNPAVGLTFAQGLRAILRQDPNIVMVGEIRDTETAEIAVRAAMTGHLVLSTLHTNSSVNSLTRLIDMGVEPFLIASALNTVVGQRLVRRICTHCAVPYTPVEEEAQMLSEFGLPNDRLRRGLGCAECAHTGYKGRIAIHEVLAVDDPLRSMILKRSSDYEYLEYALKNGLETMLQDGLTKAAAGLTSIQEVYRVTSRY